MAVVSSSDDDRYLNLKIIDDTVENKVNAVVNDDKTENITEINSKNDKTTVDRNEWTTVPKNIRFVKSNKEVRVSRSGRLTTYEDRTEVG